MTRFNIAFILAAAGDREPRGLVDGGDQRVGFDPVVLEGDEPGYTDITRDPTMRERGVDKTPVVVFHPELMGDLELSHVGEIDHALGAAPRCGERGEQEPDQQRGPGDPRAGPRSRSECRGRLARMFFGRRGPMIA